MNADIIQLSRHGGPEEMRLNEVELTEPAPGELLIRQTAVGVNYHDVYVRSGLYQTLPLPGVPGIEAVGVVEALGASVSGFAIGDRVGYVAPAYGAYASARNLPAALAVKLPDFLEDAPAAASLMKALTVCVLLTRAYPVKAGDSILVHAAAGGVGQLLCSWASHLGATVIGTVGNRDKADGARTAGAQHIIYYRDEDFVARVRDITGGNGVNAVYDSVGADTFLKSVDCLDFEGTLVNFGQSSGPVSPFSPGLMASRSLGVVRPIVFHYLRTPDRLHALSDAVFAAFELGNIRPITPIQLPLSQAAEAHRILEARQSPGGVVLIPGESS